MSECRSCGLEVEPRDGACPECGAAMDGTTEAFAAVVAPDSGVAAEAGVATEPLLVVEKGHEVGERFVLDGERFSVGRDPSSDIFLNDVTVSRSHAAISRMGDCVTVIDAGSLNGTYLNGIRVDEAELEHGDRLQVGRFQMVYLAGSGS